MNRLTGREIALPAIAEAGIAHSQIARRITWHSHEGYQLLFLLGGATAYEFRQPGAQPLELSGEHFALIPPGVVHRGVRDMRPPCDLFFIILADRPKEPCRNTPFTPSDWQSIHQNFRSAELVPYPLSEQLRSAVTALTHELQAINPLARSSLTYARVRARMCEVVLESAEQLTCTQAITTHSAVVAAEEYFRTRLADKLSMSQVADHLGVSRASLFDLFKRGTGMTPNDYLLRLRVEKARDLLLTPTRSVTDIGFETGFGSSQYFSTVFRKYTGQTPREFRQMMIGTPSAITGKSALK